MATSYSFAVSELAEIGHPVGAVHTTPATAVAYLAVSGNDDGKFHVGRDSGEITVAGELNVDEAASFTLGIEGEDETGSVTTATVEISVQSKLEPCQRGIAVPDPEENPGLVNDCALLLEAMKVTGSRKLSWRPSKPMTHWSGVGIEGSPKRVTTLDLSDDALNLDFMTAGGLSFEETTPPPQIGGLTALWGLNLAGFRMRGAFPAEWGNLQNLTTFYVRGNFLSGCIPPALQDVENNDLSSQRLPYC